MSERRISDKRIAAVLDAQSVSTTTERLFALDLRDSREENAALARRVVGLEARIRAARWVLESTTQSDVQWARWILEGDERGTVPDVSDAEWAALCDGPPATGAE